MLMQSRFSSICNTCKTRIAKGAPIDYDRRTKIAKHADCADKPEQGFEGRMFDMAYEDQCAERCGL